MSSRSRPSHRPAKPKKDVLRVATYRRISTNEVNQPHSLEAQERSLREYVERDPTLVFEKDFSDRLTGTTTERPGLEAMLDAAAAGEFDVVLFYRIDRLARSVYGFMEILHELDECGVALRSATEPFETMTPAGKLMAQMLASFAEFEHDVLLDRIHEGFNAKAVKGEWLGGPAPFGYANDREHQTLAVVPDEAAIVRRIYRSYLDGVGARTVAESLNTAGITHRGGRPWNPMSVLRVVGGSVYAGLIERADEFYPGLHPAIVSRETFEAVQALRATKSAPDQHTKLASGTTEFILTGTARCSSCGRSLVGQTANARGKRYRYYGCSGKPNQARSQLCSNERVDADALEAMVIDRILASYQDSELFPGAVARAAELVPDVTDELDEQLAAVQSAMAKTEVAQGRYFEAFEEGSLTAEVFAERLSTLRERMGAQEAELRVLLQRREEVDPRGVRLIDLEKAARQIEEAFGRSEGWRAKRALVGALVESVVVSPGRQVQLTLRVPAEGADGPAVALSGGPDRRKLVGSNGQGPGQTGDATALANVIPLVPAEAQAGWTSFRTGSQVVEVLGIEPRSVGF